MLADMLKTVRAMVEYHCFADLPTGWIDPIYAELCMIIAEVLLSPLDSVVSINGSRMKMHRIQEVFCMLQCGHLRLVAQNFEAHTGKVYNKKAYLRTALYNAVFECVAAEINAGNNAEYP